MKNRTANSLWKYCFFTILLLLGIITFQLVRSESNDIPGYLMLICLLMPFMLGLSAFADKNKIMRIFYTLIFIFIMIFFVSESPADDVEFLLFLFIPLAIVTFPSSIISFYIFPVAGYFASGNIVEQFTGYIYIVDMFIFFLFGYLQWFYLLPKLAEYIETQKKKYAAIAERIKVQGDSGTGNA